MKQRSETRMLCAEIVDVRWKDKGGRGRKGTAILEDISASGACLQFDLPVPVDSTVQIHHPKGLLEGRVRYCVYREIGYFVGLQFSDDSKWSPRQFQPQHFLDLHRLLSRAIRTAAKRPDPKKPAQFLLVH
ncbi:MAG: PilZ domain-containing protein [Bryobacterales bacterium]|jgi:hypothetical protein|nr:PilZ domain-containing protein [Bryobacterales bacterium]